MFVHANLERDFHNKFGALKTLSWKQLCVFNFHLSVGILIVIVSVGILIVYTVYCILYRAILDALPSLAS